MLQVPTVVLNKHCWRIYNLLACWSFYNSTVNYTPDECYITCWFVEGTFAIWCSTTDWTCLGRHTAYVCSNSKPEGAIVYDAIGKITLQMCRIWLVIDCVGCVPTYKYGSDCYKNLASHRRDHSNARPSSLPELLTSKLLDETTSNVWLWSLADNWTRWLPIIHLCFPSHSHGGPPTQRCPDH